jgi:hypothetical protein
MAVPYTFGNATAAIPLSQLDSNFATTITLGNTAIQLGNTVTTLNNMTLANVTISSGNVTLTNVVITNANVTSSLTLSGGTANAVAYLNASKVLTTGSALTFDGTNLGVGTTSAVSRLTVVESVAGGEADLLIWNTSGTAGDRSAIYLSAASGTPLGRAAAIKATVGAGNDHSLLFFTNGAFSDPAERARIDSSGDLLVGNTSPGGSKFEVYASSEIARFYNTSGQGTIRFVDGLNVTKGSIVWDGTSTVYNMTSDYRLKTVIGPVVDAGHRIDALQPVEYTWNSNGSRTCGFLAHQFQEVYAGSVTGTKDAVDDDGKPVYQQMQASTSEVIADLVAEIQSLRQRVAQLESN